MHYYCLVQLIELLSQGLDLYPDRKARKNLWSRAEKEISLRKVIDSEIIQVIASRRDYLRRHLKENLTQEFKS